MNPGSLPGVGGEPACSQESFAERRAQVEGETKERTSPRCPPNQGSYGKVASCFLEFEKVPPLDSRGILPRATRPTPLTANHPELDIRSKLDPPAIADLHDRIFPELFRYAHFRTGDSTVAEDVAAEAFLRLLEALRSGRGPDLQGVRGWLFGTASHVIADHFRHKFGRREGPLFEGLPAPGPGPSQLTEGRDIERSIRNALLHLTEDQRQVLALRFHAGMSLAEVAKILRKKPNAVKALQFRGLTALRRALEDIQ